MNSIRPLALVAALAGAALQLPAQQAPQDAGVRVTLIAGTAPSKGGRAEVVRRARLAPHNVVIVDLNATADDLGAALAMLHGLRAQFGDTSTTDLRARSERVRPGPRWETSEYRKWLQGQLLRLRRAPLAPLADFGKVQSVQITLPPRSVAPVGPQ